MDFVLLFRKSSYYLTILLAFSMPVIVKLLPVMIGLWVASLIGFYIAKRKLPLDIRIPLILLLIFYLAYMAGLFWSEDKNTARFMLEEKFSLILFPVVFAAFGKLLKEWINHILLAFILGCIFSSAICLLFAVWDSITLTNAGILINTIDPDYSSWEFGGSHFRYINLSMFLHPAYFSVYLLFGSVCNIVFLKRKTYASNLMIIGMYSATTFFLVMIYFLSSKAVIVNTTILAIVFSLVLLISTKRLISKVSIFFVGTILIFIALQNPRFSTITKVLKDPARITEGNSDDSFISRLHIWQAGIEIISDNLLIGVGPGDTGNELVKKYQYHNFKDPLKIKANAHNQYIETFIDLGLFGFLILISILAYPFYKAWKMNDVLFMSFLFIMGFNFLFESMLNTQAGIVFFTFFYCLLSVRDKPALLLWNEPENKRQPPPINQ